MVLPAVPVSGLSRRWVLRAVHWILSLHTLKARLQIRSLILVQYILYPVLHIQARLVNCLQEVWICHFRYDDPDGVNYNISTRYMQLPRTCFLGSGTEYPWTLYNVVLAWIHRPSRFDSSHEIKLNNLFCIMQGKFSRKKISI